MQSPPYTSSQAIRPRPAGATITLMRSSTATTSSPTKRRRRSSSVASTVYVPVISAPPLTASTATSLGQASWQASHTMRSTPRQRAHSVAPSSELSSADSPPSAPVSASLRLRMRLPKRRRAPSHSSSLPLRRSPRHSSARRSYTPTSACRRPISPMASASSCAHSPRQTPS